MSEREHVGSMRTSLWGQVGIDFSVTEEGKVHITFDLIGKHFVGADFDAAQQEEFAQYFVATCHQAKARAEAECTAEAHAAQAGDG